MASQIFRPLPVIRIGGIDGTPVTSKTVDWPNTHLPNSDIISLEVIAEGPEFDSPLRSSSTGGSISASIEDILEHFRILNVKVDFPSEVRDYLYLYPDLVELLEYVIEAVYDHFSSGIQLSLEMYQDQEMQYERLTLYVRQYIYSDTIMETIKRIRRDYHQLFPEIMGGRGRFLLTTDFHVPR